MSDPRISNMVTRLIEETVRGRVVWRIADVPETITLGTNDIFTLFVETNFRDTRFAMYEVRYKHYTDEYDYYWNEKVILAILDSEDRVLWPISGTPEIYELFADVRQKVAGVDQLLNYFR
ncbi:hypothetical protein D3C76_774770 [compost metagenome]